MTYSEQLAGHVALFEEMDGLAAVVREAGNEMARALEIEGKVFFCGNGGSAADAQHMAAELTGRFVRERRPLAGIALTTDTSAITAIANDYGYERVFARQLEALATIDDCLVVLSTSGNSPSVIEAARSARNIDGMGIPVIGLLGRTGGNVRALCTTAICVPSDVTARIQEAHGFIGHALCAHVEAKLGL
jgi:D-sedoheptulose 7-phosphate isomerase